MVSRLSQQGNQHPTPVDSVDHGFSAKAAPTPPVRGHGSPLCSKIVIYRDSVDPNLLLLDRQIQ